MTAIALRALVLPSFLAAAFATSCAAPSRSAIQSAEPARVASTWQTIGTSAMGRDVRAIDLGRGGPRVCVIAGIHGDEQEGLRHLPDVVDLLRDVPWTVRLIEDASPDGTALGTRGTASGVDPNRNWPASNFETSARNGPRPLSEPEIAAVHRDLVRFDPELVIVLHSARSGPFVNFDGPAEAYAEQFSRGAGQPWRVQPSMGYPTPGSLGTWMGIDRQVPILTIEFARGAPAEETGPALLGGLRAVLDPGDRRPPIHRSRVR